MVEAAAEAAAGTEDEFALAGAHLGDAEADNGCAVAVVAGCFRRVPLPIHEDDE